MFWGCFLYNKQGPYYIWEDKIDKEKCYRVELCIKEYRSYIQGSIAKERRKV
jgi:hypothetical protein